MNDARNSNLVSQARAEGDAVIVALNGEVDLNTSPELRTALLQLFERHRPVRMVLDLSQVPYIDSSALAVLVEVRRRVGRVALTGLQPRVRGLLEIARLNTIFHIAATEAEALGG